MSSGILPGAHDFVISHAQFIDNSQNFTINAGGLSGEYNFSVSGKTSEPIAGLQTLLKASVPEAAHDSSARYPPPKCHPGTRREYIDEITTWAVNSNRRGRIFWVYGPAGVGKSALAQTCAETLENRLGASFFFSKSNFRDNPHQLFTSISYQLATKIDSYSDILNYKLCRDPTLVEKSITQQFQDLIATPLAELRGQGRNISELIIIVDGLDECAGNTGSKIQCDIIEIVASSVRNQNIPFLWAFFSRPDPHILATFSSPHVLPLSIRTELPISRKSDVEIARYLTDELKKIKREHNLPASWPSDRDIGALVNLSAGLFIYAATIVRFVGVRDSSGPEDQLRSVLALATRTEKDSSNHPLYELDLFYMLIMQRIPSKTLLTTQKILLATTFYQGADAAVNANLLGLSKSQFWNACHELHSVLMIKPDDLHIRFYHVSFLEFLLDPKRSARFCVKSDCAVALRVDFLDKLNRVHANDSPSIGISLTWPSPAIKHRYIYQLLVQAFFNLCQCIPLDANMLAALTKFSYDMIPVFFRKGGIFASDELSLEIFLQNIPADIREKIIRPCPWILFRCHLLLKPWRAERDRPYILGQGKNRALCWKSGEGTVISQYPSHGEMISNFIKNKITKSAPKDAAWPPNNQ